MLASLAVTAQNKLPERYGMSANDSLPKGLSVDSLAPEFRAISIEGDTLNSKDLLKKGPVVLLFYRGQWCGVCIRYLSNLTDSMEHLTKAGATVVAVGPELIDKANKTKEKTAAGFHIVSDTSQKIMRDYDVLFTVTEGYSKMILAGKQVSIAKSNGHDKPQIPVPATYVIGTDGIIKLVHFDYNFRYRATVK